MTFIVVERKIEWEKFPHISLQFSIRNICTTLYGRYRVLFVSEPPEGALTKISELNSF